jgi:diguanylate cyclase (GGDEF)-like protein
MDRLGQTMARLKRSGQRGALMFLDLDNFKPLNDQHGHDVGDLLLIEVAQRLKKMVREADTVARFGGDEFVLILGDLDEDESAAKAHAFGVAQKVLDALSQPCRLAVPPVDGHPAREIEHTCSASIGLAMFMGQPGTEEDLLRRADSAMYLAKQSGRHTIRFDASAAGQASQRRVSDATASGSDITA